MKTKPWFVITADKYVNKLLTHYRLGTFQLRATPPPDRGVGVVACAGCVVMCRDKDFNRLFESACRLVNNSTNDRQCFCNYDSARTLLFTARRYTSVRLSVTFRYCVKTAKRIVNIVRLSRAITLVL